MHRFIRAALALALAFTAALPAAQAQTKKLVRIHTAGPADLGVDNTMLAHQFMTYVNANSRQRRGQGVPEQPARPVARGDRGDAPGLGRVGHHRRAGGVRVVRQAHRRARPAVHVEELRARDRGARRPGRQGARGRHGEGRLQGAVVGGELGLPQRRHREEGSQDRGRPEGPEDPHHPDQGLRLGDQRDGRQRHADELRRDLHLAAERRARRLRAHRGDHRVVQAQRGRVLHRDDAPPDGPDGAGVLAGRVEEVHAGRAGR